MNPGQHYLNGGRAASAAGRARISQGDTVDFGRQNGLEDKHCMQVKSVWTARQAATVNPLIMR